MCQINTILLGLTKNDMGKCLKCTASLRTYDAQKASEAAVHCRALDPSWLAHAQDIHHGVLAVTNGRDILGKG